MEEEVIAPTETPDTPEPTESSEEQTSEYRYKQPEPEPTPNRALRRLMAKQVRHAQTRKERQIARIAGLLLCNRCGMPSLAATANRCQCKAMTHQQMRREEFIRLLSEQLQAGTLSINEARSMLGMPPVEMVPTGAETEGSQA